MMRFCKENGHKKQRCIEYIERKYNLHYNDLQRGKKKRREDLKKTMATRDGKVDTFTHSLSPVRDLKLPLLRVE